MLHASCCCARLYFLFILQLLKMKPGQRKKPQATKVLSFRERSQQPRFMELGKPANSGPTKSAGQRSPGANTVQEGSYKRRPVRVYNTLTKVQQSREK